MTNLFTPFQGFSSAFHYLFTLQIVEKLRKSTLLQKTFSLFTEKIYRKIKMQHHNTTCIATFIKECLATFANRNYSKKSISSYQWAMDRFAKHLDSIGVKRVQDVNRHHLEEYRLHMIEQGLAGSTIHIYLRGVQHLFKYLEKKQLIFINPARELAFPLKERRLGRVPSEEEVKEVLAQPDLTTPIGIRDRAVLEVFYTCGLRLEEMTRLTLSDLDIRQAVLRVMGKGRKERILPLGKQAVFWLKKYIELSRPKLCTDQNENSLWVSMRGSRLRYVSIADLLRKYGEMTGMSFRLTPHCLRRACATHMLRGGVLDVN